MFSGGFFSDKLGLSEGLLINCFALFLNVLISPTSPSTRSWSFLLTNTINTFLSLIGGGFSAAGSIGGGSLVSIPESTSIVVVTRKNIRSKKAMSAIEPALISPTSLFLLAIFLIEYAQIGRPYMPLFKKSGNCRIDYCSDCTKSKQIGG